MKLNHLLTALLSSSISHVLASEKQEIVFDSMQNETLHIPRRPYNTGPFFNRRFMCDYLNSFNLSDIEGKGTAELIEEKIVLDRRNNGFEYHGELIIHHENLDEELFSAAVELGNIDRLRDLFARNRHLSLSSEQKAKILKIALISCDQRDAATSGEIFKILLHARFYPRDGKWPQTGGNSDFPLLFVLEDARLYQPFLDYDSKIFASEKNFNYIHHLVGAFKFREAKTALLLGCNPKVSLPYGRNVLDWALDTPHYMTWHDRELERHELVKALKEDHGMVPSNTIENLEWICKTGDWERAINLVRLGGMKYDNTTPLCVAFRFGDVDLINAAVETYFDEIPVHQLHYDVNRYLRQYRNQHGPEQQEAIDKNAKELVPLKMRKNRMKVASKAEHVE